MTPGADRPFTGPLPRKHELAEDDRAAICAIYPRLATKPAPRAAGRWGSVALWTVLALAAVASVLLAKLRVRGRG